jgi:hypothetical protein
MITTAIALLALGGQKLPDNPSFDFSGLPMLRTAEKIDVQIHTVTLEIGTIKDGYVDVSTLTVYKNLTGAAVRATLIVPRRRYGDAGSGQPSFDISATWDKKALPLTPASDHGYSEAVGKVVKYASDLSAKVKLDPGATHALRITYEVPIGKSGYEQHQRAVGYIFDGDKTIDQMNIAYKYNEKTVFRLPEMHPNMGWQVGEKGAFVRQNNYWPDNKLTYLTFYPGGF